MAEQCHCKLFQTNYLTFPLHLLNLLQLLSETNNFRILTHEGMQAIVCQCVGSTCSLVVSYTRYSASLGIWTSVISSFLTFFSSCSLLSFLLTLWNSAERQSPSFLFYILHYEAGFASSLTRCSLRHCTDRQWSSQPQHLCTMPHLDYMTLACFLPFPPSFIRSVMTCPQKLPSFMSASMFYSDLSVLFFFQYC